MNAQTLEALLGSIYKWEKIVAGIGVDNGILNCPLCQLFAHLKDETNAHCAGCPVAISTGATRCDHSPYTSWCAVTYGQPIAAVKNLEQRLAAQAELDFLKSLLPRDAA